MSRYKEGVDLNYIDEEPTEKIQARVKDLKVRLGYLTKASLRKSVESEIHFLEKELGRRSQ